MSGYAPLWRFLVRLWKRVEMRIFLSGEATIPLCPQKQNKEGSGTYQSKEPYNGLAMVLGIISQDGG